MRRLDGHLGTHPKSFAERLEVLRAEQTATGHCPHGDTTISIHMELRLGDPLADAGRWSVVGDGYGDREMVDRRHRPTLPRPSPPTSKPASSTSSSSPSPAPPTNGAIMLMP